MIGRFQCDDDVEDTLQLLPSSLHEFYDHIFSKMEQRLQETPRMLHRDRRVLEWLVAARRPLTLKELSHAVSLEPNHAEPSLGGIVNEDLLTEHCGQLIHVSQETKEVVLCHFSVREYLTWRDYTNLQKAHHHAALSCLTYLLFDAFKKPCDGTTELARRREAYPLLGYATLYARDHRKELLECNQALVSHLDRLFLAEPSISCIRDTGLGARINGWTARATIAVSCPPIDDEYCNVFDECCKFRGWVPRNNEPQPIDEDGPSCPQLKCLDYLTLLVLLTAHRARLDRVLGIWHVLLHVI